MIDKYFWRFIIATTLIITLIINLYKGLPETKYPEQPYFEMLGAAIAVILVPFIFIAPILIYFKIKKGEVTKEDFYTWYFSYWVACFALGIIGTLNL